MTATEKPWEGVDDDVRTEGLIDRDALGQFMDERGLPGKGEPVETKYLSGGSSNEIFQIKRGEHLCALRRPPRVVPEGRNKTMLREYQVLEALNGTDVPHPEALAACDDESLIGGCFYLMGLIDGWSPMSMGDAWPEPFGSDLNARKGLGIQLVDGIARLSKVDWKARGLEGFGKPDGFLERQADRWVSQYETMKTRDLEGVDVVAQWLRDNKPSVYEPGIIHGDYQFANVMYHHGAPGRLAAIIDWEMTTIGDPLLDLGWILVHWGPEGEDMQRHLNLDGMPTLEEMCAHYELHSGRSTEDLIYYIVLARFKLGIVLEQSYSRFLAGAAVNPKVEIFGPLVLELLSKSASLAALHP